jgi:hypothetical protein
MWRLRTFPACSLAGTLTSASSRSTYSLSQPQAVSVSACSVSLATSSPRHRAIKPQLLAAIQCVRRWQRAGLGDVEVAAKSTMTDDEMELSYDLNSWGGDYHETQHQEFL